MISFINEKLRFILIFVLVLLIAAFLLWDYNSTSHGQHSEVIGKIGGRNIHTGHFSSAHMGTRILLTLRTGRNIGTLSNQQEQMLYQQTWNRMIILNAAEKAGIQASNEEISEYIQNSPLFQKDGNFSFEEFKQFNENFLKSRGITDGRFEELIAEQIIFEEMSNLISNMATSNPSSIQERIGQLYGQATVQLVLVDKADIEAAIQPTEEDLKTFYDQNLSNYRTEERRIFEYIYFKTDDDLSTLEEPERKKKINELGEVAYTFCEPFFPQDENEKVPSFTEAAQNAKMEILTTEAVTSSEPLIQDIKDIEATRIAYGLTLAQPVSHQIQVANGFMVLHLKQIIPSKPLPQEDVADQLSQDYIQRKVQQELTIQGEQQRSSIQKELDLETPWETIVTNLELKTSDVPPFEPSSNELKIDHADQIRRATQELTPGGISDFQYTNQGGFIVYLVTRETPSADRITALTPVIKQQMTREQRYLFVQQWIQAQYKAPGNTLPIWSRPQSES
ncbi:MAG: SurA N-terminal domain-containing protein [Verrucomicrobiota bacterium]